MYDYLTEGLPPEHRCDKLRLAETGQLALGTDQMTPLQLAAIRGLPYIFQHIMTKELTKILWIWGPVTQYQISLEGIDSAGHNASGMQRRPSRALARACDPAGYLLVAQGMSYAARLAALRLSACSAPL